MNELAMIVSIFHRHEAFTAVRAEEFRRAEMHELDVIAKTRFLPIRLGAVGTAVRLRIFVNVSHMLPERVLGEKLLVTEFADHIIGVFAAVITVHVKSEVRFSREFFLTVRTNVGFLAVDLGDVRHKRVETPINRLVALTALNSSFFARTFAPSRHRRGVVGKNAAR